MPWGNFLGNFRNFAGFSRYQSHYQWLYLIVRLLVTLVQSFLCCVLILHKCWLSYVASDCIVSACYLVLRLIVTFVLHWIFT